MEQPFGFSFGGASCANEARTKRGADASSACVRAITSWCRSCGKTSANSPGLVFALAEPAKVSAGLAKGWRSPARGETTV
jgi:hypothetical protein